MIRRILLISVVDPAAGTGGGWTATRGLIRTLEAALPGVELECVALPERSSLHRRFRQALGIAGSLTGGLPAKVGYATCRKVVRKLRATSAPDLVVINGSDMFWVLPYLPSGVPVVAVEMNLEYRLVEQQGTGLGWFGVREMARHREYELAGLSQVRNVVFLSGEECEEALHACPELRTLVMPPAFTYQPWERAASGDGPIRLGLVSNLHWWPNQEGLAWFLREVWPAIDANVELALYGPGSESAALGGVRIRGYGIVSDVREAWEGCDIMIAPILRGAGVRIKLAEAIYNGVPVVTTTIGAKGLPSMEGVMVIGTAEEWIAFLNGHQARDWAMNVIPAAVREQYSFESAAKGLRTYLAALGQ